MISENHFNCKQKNSQKYTSYQLSWIKDDNEHLKYIFGLRGREKATVKNSWSFWILFLPMRPFSCSYYADQLWRIWSIMLSYNFAGKMNHPFLPKLTFASFFILRFSKVAIKAYIWINKLILIICSYHFLSINNSFVLRPRFREQMILG